MAEQQNMPPDDHPEDLIELPLFPLNVVLFPGMVLPLHIFEERYKAMIGDCIERVQPFGVVLIKEGPEVGGPAEPFAIGTSARVTTVDRLEDGRMNLLTTGELRFETASITQQEPHMVGQVRYLEEHPGEDQPELMAEVGEEYTTFLRNLSSLTGGWTANAETPQEPITLAYGVASTLDLPRHMRQELLEMVTATQRLERLLPLLKRGNEALLEQVAKRNPFQGPRLN